MDTDRTPEALLLESIVENLPDMIFVKDAEELRFVRFNRAGERLLGWERAKLIGRNDHDFFPETEADFFTSKDREVLRGGRLVDIPEEPIHTATGLRWLHTKKIPIVDEESGRALFLLGISRDVTELREARVALEEREARLRVLLEHFPGVVWSADDELRLTWVGGARAARIGLTGAAGEPVGRLPAPAGTDLAALAAAARDGTPQDYAFTAAGLHFVAQIVPQSECPQAKVIGVALDVTDRRLLEAEKVEARLQRAQRLEALGVLAGGIAHDFNNLLTGILGHASLAQALLPAGSPARAHVERIEAVTERAAALTRQMLAYSGRGRFVVEAVDLSVLVRDLADLLSVSVTKQARLVLQLEEGLPPVEADAAQLRQVVLNLLTNASDALRERPGTVRLSTGRVEADAAWLAHAHPELPVPPGSYVSFEVTDDGAGMEETVRARMFDPFFTTKAEGHGLGLAATLGIVRGHRGTVRVRSASGDGTTVTVLLPARPDLAIARAVRRPAREAPAAHGRVLVADDEDEVRHLAATVLAQQGYDVLLARDGVEAIGLLRDHADDVRLVLLDLTMPRLDGLSALAEVRRIRPDVPVLLSSGYDELDVATRISGDGNAAFLCKPWAAKDLLARVGELLTRS